MAAAAAASFFGALFIEFGEARLLGAASTALVLAAYWIAEHELGQRRGH